jgi:hypothetical protein
MVSRELMSVRFHVDCYQVWDAERLALYEKNGVQEKAGEVIQGPSRARFRRS